MNKCVDGAISGVDPGFLSGQTPKNLTDRRHFFQNSAGEWRRVGSRSYYLIYFFIARPIR